MHAPAQLPSNRQLLHTRLLPILPLLLSVTLLLTILTPITAQPRAGLAPFRPIDAADAAPTPATAATVATETVNTLIYISSDKDGAVNEIAFANEDILLFDTVTNQWSMFFDGSDVGIIGDINAFHVETNGTLLLSFIAPIEVPDVGHVERSDIVRFVPTTFGEATAGAFSWVFDGSDVELDEFNKAIDAIGRTPDGRLVVSVSSNVTVGGMEVDDSDLLLFTDSTLGEATAGTWARYFDGSDIGLTMLSEDIRGLWIDSDNGDIYLNALSYDVSSTDTLVGDSNDIFICTPSSWGEETACTFHLFWDGESHGFTQFIDGISIGASTQRLLPDEGQGGTGNGDPTLTNRLYLPVIIGTTSQP
jgi:hypothetical protein